MSQQDDLFNIICNIDEYNKTYIDEVLSNKNNVVVDIGNIEMVLKSFEIVQH